MTAEVRLGELAAVEGDAVDLAALKAANLIRRDMQRARIMLSGKVTRAPSPCAARTSMSPRAPRQLLRRPGARSSRRRPALPNSRPSPPVRESSGASRETTGSKEDGQKSGATRRYADGAHGAAQPFAVRVRRPVGLPHRHPHTLAGHQPRPAAGAVRAKTRAAFSNCSTCSPAAPWSG